MEPPRGRIFRGYLWSAHVESSIRHGSRRSHAAS